MARGVPREHVDQREHVVVRVEVEGMAFVVVKAAGGGTSTLA